MASLILGPSEADSTTEESCYEEGMIYPYGA